MINYKVLKKGIALFVTIITIMVVLVLAGVILNIVSTQSRLTHHQVSRIQAYYAGMAGINYAYEQLRLANWNTNSCPAPAGCSLPVDTAFPNSIIQPINIIIRPAGSAGCINPPSGSACISVTTTYTYTP
jgi:Tfp pilus assembly protein PilX